ncbi:hypothetical protein [Calycomorphotria hydatis]|uniref:Uncharacterized protein n=1 Tax=Calycomorphotria hydatis TaxID=2528027 RepID=A0A517T7K0_9PLAN|nr:hypothetical protein [Calycomorphotria hydatis]QDT64352.1 hypothetical protein V22_15860 [Calycomorphotria hydatis]
MDNAQRRSPFLVVQIGVILIFTVAVLMLPAESRKDVAAAVRGEDRFQDVVIPREKPLVIEPLYDDPSVVSFEDLALVLEKIRPKFEQRELSPNYVEHALRSWGAYAKFKDPSVMSGEQMVEFLTDHGKYMQSWGSDHESLLINRDKGIAIRWGKEPGQSVHHDHWLACLTEAGVSIDTPIWGPGRHDSTLRDALYEAMRDFQVDEIETEWSAMAFGLWLPPAENGFRTGTGRWVDFDLLAKRLVRGHKRFGVCSGTHRVYSMMVLLRLDDEFSILSPTVRDEVYGYLANVRDLMIDSQMEDGRSPAGWAYGADAIEHADEEYEYRQVIATGHHLEWLAIAYPELHPPRDVIRRAAQWLVKNVCETPQENISSMYTFYSHVGNALALWRNTHPAIFWEEWRKTHPLIGGDVDPHTGHDHSHGEETAKTEELPPLPGEASQAVKTTEPADDFVPPAPVE